MNDRVKRVKEHGLSNPNNLGLHPRDTEGTKESLCVLCVSVVEFQVRTILPLTLVTHGLLHSPCYAGTPV